MEQKENNVSFDKKTGNFIVTIRMSPEQYGRFAQEETIPDLDSLVFEKETGQFVVPVYMSPEEYGIYVQEKTLPTR